MEKEKYVLDAEPILDEHGLLDDLDQLREVTKKISEELEHLIANPGLLLLGGVPEALLYQCKAIHQSVCTDCAGVRDQGGVSVKQIAVQQHALHVTFQAFTKAEEEIVERVSMNALYDSLRPVGMSHPNLQ